LRKLATKKKKKRKKKTLTSQVVYHRKAISMPMIYEPLNRPITILSLGYYVHHLSWQNIYCATYLKLAAVVVVAVTVVVVVTTVPCCHSDADMSRLSPLNYQKTDRQTKQNKIKTADKTKPKLW